MGGGGWSNVEGDFGKSLFVGWSEMSENREFMDESKRKSAEVVCSCF